MRRYLAATALAGALAAGGLRGGARAEDLDGVYVGAGAGAAFLQGERAQRSVSGAPRVSVSNARTTFDTGARVSAEVGYGFGNGLRIELEGTAFGASRRRTRGAPVAPAAALTDGRASGYEVDAGAFVNAIYEFDLSGLNLPLDVRPYVGGGVGYLRTIQQDLPVLASNPGGATKLRGDRDALGAQAIAGLAFPVAFAPGLAITAEYRGAARTGGQYDVTLEGRGPSRRARLDDDSAFAHSVLIGLRYAFGAAPPQPPPPASAPRVEAQAPARSYLVFFDWDRADLTERARQVVAEAAQASARVAATRIEVAGNADRSGAPSYNLALSRRRADLVAAELVRLGVPREAIGVAALGDSKPLVPTAAGVREPQNRRVEIVLR